MDPMTIAALVQAAIGLAGAVQKGIKGFQDKRKAKAYQNTPRPTMTNPPALDAALNSARAGLNPPVNNQLLQEIGNTEANNFDNAARIGTSSADRIAAAVGSNANAMRMKRQFMADAQARGDNKLATYQALLGTVAGQQNENFKFNKIDPYLNAQETAAALNKSGTENSIGAMGDIAAGAGAAAGTMLQGEQMNTQTELTKGLIEAMTGGKTKSAASAAKQVGELSAKTASKTGANPMDNSLTRGLTESVLPKITNNTNLPVAERIAAGKTEVDPTDNSLTKRLAEILLPKVAEYDVNKFNANIPTFKQVSMANPITGAPKKIVTTTTDGKVMENGKPMDYSAAQKLVNDDAAFNDASGKIPLETTDKYEVSKAVELGKKKLAKNRIANKSLLEMLVSNPDLINALMQNK